MTVQDDIRTDESGAHSIPAKWLGGVLILVVVAVLIFFGLRSDTPTQPAPLTPEEKIIERRVNRRLSFVNGDQETKALVFANYKREILDEALSAKERAHAVNDLLALSLRENDTDFILEHIFTGEVFGAMIVEGDKSLASRRLAEFGNGLYPTTENSIRIAAWYARQIEDNPTLPSETRQEYIARIESLVAQAEELAPEAIADSARSHVVNVYTLIGIGNYRLARATDRDFSKAKQWFERALAVGPAQELYAPNLVTRLFYADLLLEESTGSADDEKLAELLRPFTQPPAAVIGGEVIENYEYSMQKLIARVVEGIEDHHSVKRADLSLMGDLYPPFRAFFASRKVVF